MERNSARRLSAGKLSSVAGPRQDVKAIGDASAAIDKKKQREALMLFSLNEGLGLR